MSNGEKRLIHKNGYDGEEDEDCSGQGDEVCSRDLNPSNGDGPTSDRDLSQSEGARDAQRHRDEFNQSVNTPSRPVPPFRSKK